MDRGFEPAGGVQPELKDKLQLPPRSGRQWKREVHGDPLAGHATKTLLELRDLLRRYGPSHEVGGMCRWVVSGGQDDGPGRLLTEHVYALQRVFEVFGWGGAKYDQMFPDHGWCPERQYLADRVVMYIEGYVAMERGVTPPGATIREHLTSRDRNPRLAVREAPPVGLQSGRVLQALRYGDVTLRDIAARAAPCSETAASARIRELRRVYGFDIETRRHPGTGNRAQHFTYHLKAGQ